MVNTIRLILSQAFTAAAAQAQWVSEQNHKNHYRGSEFHILLQGDFEEKSVPPGFIEHLGTEQQSSPDDHMHGP